MGSYYYWVITYYYNNVKMVFVKVQFDQKPLK